MKKIGETNAGLIMVEMYPDEFDALVRLAIVTNGKALSELQGPNKWIGAADISTALGAVETFAMNQSLLIETIDQLTRIKQKMGGFDDDREK